MYKPSDFWENNNIHIFNITLSTGEIFKQGKSPTSLMQGQYKFQGKASDFSEVEVSLWWKSVS